MEQLRLWARQAGLLGEELREVVDVSLKSIFKGFQGQLSLPLFLRAVQKPTRSGQESGLGVMEEAYGSLSSPLIVLQ